VALALWPGRLIPGAPAAPVLPRGWRFLVVPKHGQSALALSRATHPSWHDQQHGTQKDLKSRFCCCFFDEIIPPKWSQHRIPSTNQHPISMGTKWITRHARGAVELRNMRDKWSKLEKQTNWKAEVSVSV